MKYSNSIEYNISTKFDSAGLTKLQTQIREVELSLQKMSNAGNFESTIEKARNGLQGLNKALTNAFNPSLGIIDISKFRTELAAGKVDLESVAAGFRLAGTQGQTAFNSLIGQLGRFDAGITRTSSAVDKMFVTFQNTFRWGVISSFFSQFMNAIHSSVEYAKELDDSLTQIMLVTDYSRDSMNEYAKAANEAAKAVGQTTVGMTNASLIFAQQGYDLNQSQQLATLSAKLANASQQDTAATSDQITAYMNAYGLQDNMEELAQAMDNWALIANISAADVEEIALASQRAASMANAVGVSGEALAAQIATIESVTREAPEQIGNGLKTLYARFSDLQLGKEDEDGITLGKVTGTLESIGVQVLDSLGNVRSMDDIMEDLMAIWQDLDDTTQEAVAQTLAGKHQVNRFTALMDNADMYQEYLGATGEGAAGTLEQMNQEYMDSLQGRMATLQATLESLFNDVFTTDMVYPLIDALTKLAEAVDTLFKSVGGGPTIILGLASAFTRLFSKNIANAITDASMNTKLSKIQAENYKNAPAALSQLGLANPNANNKNTQSLLNFAQQGAQLASNMSEEGLKQYNSLLDENVRLTNAAENAHKEFSDTLSSLNAILGTTVQETDAIFTDENGLNTSLLTGVLKELKDDDFKGNEEKINSAVEAVKKYISALDALEIEIEEYKRTEDSTGEGSPGIRNATQLVREAVVEIGRVGGLSKEQLEALKNSINDIDTQTENWENEAKDTLAEIQRLAGGADNLRKILEQLASQSKSISPEKVRALADQLDRTYSNRQATQGAKDNIDRLGQGYIDTQKIAASRKVILDTVGAVGQLASAWQSLGHIYTIWSNKNLTDSEKLLQTITNLTFVVPMLVSSFKQLTGIQSFSQIQEGFSAFFNLKSLKDEVTATQNAVTAAEEAAATASIDLDEKRAAAKAAVTAAKEAEKKATEALAAQEERYNILSASEEASDKSKAASKGHVKRKQKELEEATRAVTEAEEEQLLVEQEASTGEAKITAANKAHADAAKEAAAAEAAKAAVIRAGAFIAITAIMAIISIYQAYRKEQQRLYKERVDASNELVATNKQALDSINEMYDAWKETGEGADELRQALEDQAEALGIVVTAADDYDTLRQRIEEATAAQLYYNAVLRDGDYADKPEYSDKGLDNFSQDTLNSLGISTDYSSDGNGGVIVDYQVDNYAEVYENAAAKRQELLEEIQKQQADLAKIDRATNEELYQQRYAEMQANQEEFNNIDSWMHENEAAYNDRYEQAQNLTTGLALGSQRSFDNISWEEAHTQVQRLAENNGIELSDAQITQLAHDALVAAGNLEAAADGMSDFVVASTALTNTNTDEISVWSDRFGNILDNLGASDEQKMSLFEMVDWSSDNIDEEVRNLIAQIREGLANGLSLEEIIANPNIILQPEFSWAQADIDLDYTKEEAEKMLKDAGLEGMSEDEYVQNFLEMGGAGLVDVADNVETITEEIDRLNKALKGVKEGSEEWRILNQQLEDANDRLRNMALAALQTRNGLQQLSNSWNSIQENLSSTNLVDRTIGYETLQPILGEIFNVDPSAYTADFMQGLYDEGLLEDLVNGADGALDAVREYYLNNPVGFRAYLESEGFADSADELLEIAKGIDGLNLEVGATLNDGEYIEALNNMLRNSEIGVAQLQTLFSNISGGYDVQIDYVPVEMPNIDILAEGKIGTAAEIKGANTGLSGAGKISIWTKEREPTTALMPTVSIVPLGSGSPPSTGGTGKGGGGCFVAGTLVSTVDSFKEIENIQVGDIVLSYNEEIHQNEYSVVLQTMIHNVTEEIYDLHVEDEILSVTGIHRFYIRRKHDIKWIPASDLHVGDYVLFANGTWHVISNIEVKVQSITVYNFEVSYNHNYYVGRNQILAHNKGGGGGGGGGNTNTMELKEKIDHETDYYEEVDSQLDKIGETLSGIEKQEDRLIGEKARQNQAKQIDLLDQEITLQQKKLEILQKQNNGELTDTWKQISNPSTTIINNLTQTLTEAEKTVFNNLAKGFINGKIPVPLDVDKDGIIENFEDISKALDNTENNLINKYNELVNSYNKSNSDSTKEQIEALDKIISKYEEEAGKVRENVQRYNDLQTEAQKLKNTIADLQDQIEDLRIEAYKGSLDALDNLKEINETAASFAGIMTGLKTDDPLREMTERLSRINHTFKMTKEEAKEFLESMKSDMVTDASRDYFNDLIKGLSESDLANGRIGFLTKELERLRDWGLGGENNPFGDNQQAWLETYNEVYKKLEEAASEYQEEEEGVVDTIIDYYDEIDEKQQDYMDQFEQLADKMEWLKDIYSIRYGDESYQALSDIGTKQAEVLQSSLAQQVHIYDLWAKRYKEALDSHDEELARDARQRMDEAEKNMQDLAKESAETFVDAYNDAVDAAIQKMYNNVLGDTENNLDHLDRNWEWDKKNINGYRDEVERTFEVEQLRSKYNDLLNSAQGSSLATQNKIRQQMAEQIKLLEEQKTVSEYDVKLANSKLTILQKQIALEDAQRNKNQMQLRRDTQGNYRYVYRASQNDIAKARQEYIQAVQDAYELTKDQRQKTAEELAKALKDYAKDYEDISKNMNLPAEQRAKELQELTDKFREYMQNLQEDLGDTGAGLSDVLGFMIKNGTDDIAEAAQQMLSKLGKLGTGEGTGIPWLDALAGYSKIADANVEDVTTKLLGQTAKDAEELSQQLDNVFSTIPTKIAEYTETINNTQNKTDALTDSTKAYLDTLELLPDKMQKGLAEIVKYNEELPKFLKLLEDVDKVTQDLTRLYTDELPFNLSMDASQYNAPNNEWAPVLHNNYSDKQHLGDRITSGIEEKWVMVPGSIEQYGWPIFEKQIISHFKSGGYTGKWGKDGKLAVLHEKELVLNAQDTENVYAAIKAAKQFVASLGAKSLRNYMNSKPVFNAGTDSIEQRVEIKAEFPNVRDSFEIERALINLSDSAYQYAHRNI